MSTTPPQPTASRPNRRLVIVLAVVVAVTFVVAGLVLAYMYFFGSPAPEAPSLDGALKVLLPSASPE
jgi:hypothetical protein